MTRNKLYIGLTVFIALLTLTTGTWAQQVTITLWDAIPAGGRPTFLQIVEEFQAEYPDIKVEVENVAGYGAIRERLTVAVVGNVAPNVVHQSHYGTYNFRYLGVFMPLNEYIEQDPTFNLDDWYPAFLENVSLNGEIYGIPYNVSTPVMYFAPQLFEESGLEARAPTTWDEIVDFARRITRHPDGDGPTQIWGTDNVRAPGWVMEAYLGQAGGRIINADRTEFTLNSPEGIRAWEFQQSLIHEHRVARYPGTPSQELHSNKTGFWIRSTASLRSYLDMHAESGIPIGVAPLACDVECYVPIGGGAFYAVDTGTEAERDATYKLLSFLARPENLARYSAASGYMAGHKDAFATDYLQTVFAREPEFLVTYHQLAYAQPETSAPEFDKVHGMWDERPTFLDPIYQNGMPVKPVLDDLVRRGNALLNEFYERHGRR